MVNKQGQTRLANYFEWLPVKERITLEAEVPLLFFIISINVNLVCIEPKFCNTLYLYRLFVDAYQEMKRNVHFSSIVATR